MYAETRDSKNRHRRGVLDSWKKKCSLDKRDAPTTLISLYIMHRKYISCLAIVHDRYVYIIYAYLFIYI